MSYSTSGNLMNWSLLNLQARHILEDVKIGWQNLLKQKLPEEEYHRYLHDNAGLFFGNAIDIAVVISKLRLGAEFITDFVIVKEGYSTGLEFELIELELPYSSPFTRKGYPSERLSVAIQQIQNWRNWLRENRYEAQRLFPGIGARIHRNPNFRFTIIVGNRSNSEEWLDRRNHLSEELRISIRSFDYLTSRFQERFFLNENSFYSAEGEKLSDAQRNCLANPFYKAYTNAEWRDIIRKIETRSHVIALHSDLFLDKRTYSKCYDEFVEFVCKYPCA